MKNGLLEARKTWNCVRDSSGADQMTRFRIRIPEVDFRLISMGIGQLVALAKKGNVRMNLKDAPSATPPFR